VGAVSAVAGVVLEGAEAAGVSGFEALKEKIVRETLETKFGTIWGLTVVAWLLFGLLTALLLRRDRRPGAPVLAVLFLPLLLPVLEPALSGHGSTQSPVALNFPVNAIHVGAMAVWLGGLATLLFVLPAATRQLAAEGRGRLLAGALSRFSQVALIAVAAILVTGLVQAYVYVRHLDALLETGYGRAVLAKFLLLMAVIAIGAYNRRRSVPRLRRIAAGGEAPGRAGLLLRRALRGELALLVVVLGVTAALASYAPPVSAQSGPFATETTVGPALLEMTVEPARVGANEVHLYLFDAKSGAPFSRAKEVTMTAALPEKEISLPLEPQRAGPGHYVVPSAFLNVGGDWQIEVMVRVSAFDEFTKSIEVPVR
jgi:copper transport protein